MKDNYSLQYSNYENSVLYFERSESSPRLTYIFLILFHLHLFQPKCYSRIFVLFPVFATLTAHLTNPDFTAVVIFCECPQVLRLFSLSFVPLLVFQTSFSSVSRPYLVLTLFSSIGSNWNQHGRRPQHWRHKEIKLLVEIPSPILRPPSPSRLLVAGCNGYDKKCLLT